MIVDASVAFKWIFVEDGSDAAFALLGRNDLLAPGFILAELGNGLWKKRGRGELGDPAAYAAKLQSVGSLLKFVDEVDVMPRALEMALALDHPIYDCIYLALAEREPDELVTADAKFLTKIAQSEFRHLARALA